MSDQDKLLHWVLVGVVAYAVLVVLVVAASFIWGRDPDPANKGMEWVE